MKKIKAWATTQLHRGVDYLHTKFPPNRVVLLLTPLLAPVAAAAAAWIGTHFPGIELSEGTIIAFAAAGGLALLRSGYKWVDRWQEEERSNDRAWEERQGSRATVDISVDPEFQAKVTEAMEKAAVNLVPTDASAPKPAPPGPPNPPKLPLHRPVA